ncbi:MAG TPA: hypothetical protein PKM25_17660, partial [Candidatus Ozemobacteraceae bacterium]|nr:hypothetical protein [Candidatus Ozemobacteraceae bacterium]
MLLLAMLVFWPGLPGRLDAQTSGGAGPVPITFQINDAVVKDKSLSDVSVGIGTSETGDLLLQGKTDSAGRFLAELAPGRYFASFGKRGYIPLANTVIDVVAGKPDVITVTLSMMMEEVGPGTPRRVQIILNWGSGPSQARDIDAHLICSRGESLDHIYFSQKNADRDGHMASLDVDDMDGGGPETITLQEPLPGSYSYWVHNYSGLPARLDESDVIVRVMVDNAMAGEFRLASGTPSRIWRPFKYVEVDQAGNAQLVPFAADELASRAEFISPEQVIFGTGDESDAFTTVVVYGIF